MTTEVPFACHGQGHADPLLLAADPVEAALRHVSEQALVPDAGGRVGLELELHLVDLLQPAERPDWQAVRRLVDQVPPLPHASSVTLEPGGQVELSTPPAADVTQAVAELAADLAVLRRTAAAAGLGLAGLGADPARAPRRVNPAARYASMEAHFDALGCVGAGTQMMTSTAALQVNLDAGPRAGWGARTEHLRALVPVLVAISSTSPWLGGRSNGWHSMRQGVWQGIDRGRTDPCPVGESAGDPALAWAAYALDAPVMLLSVGAEVRPVTRRVSFRDWLSGAVDLGRRPCTADLDQHLTTLFPPVRSRGYLELRSMDAMPDRWWPAMAAVAVILTDHDEAAAGARELCEPLERHAVAGAPTAWERATRDGLADAGVRRAALGCLRLAAEHAPPGLAREVADLHDLLDAGSSPAEQLRERIEEIGPVGVLLEECR